MEITVRAVECATVVAIIGELDGKTSPEAQKLILPLIEPGSKLVLDMTALTFMSSAGLRTLLLVYRQTSVQKATVALAALTEEVRDVMDMTGFLSHFTVYDTVDAAVAGLG